MFYFENKTVLPDSFTIKLESDLSSAAADRMYEATLYFSHNELTSGSEKYYLSGMSKTEEHNCIIKNQKWITSTTGNECDFSMPMSDIPLTKTGIEKQIKNKEIKAASPDQCPHGDLCYEIIQ